MEGLWQMMASTSSSALSRNKRNKNEISLLIRVRGAIGKD